MECERLSDPRTLTIVSYEHSVRRKRKINGQGEAIKYFTDSATFVSFFKHVSASETQRVFVHTNVPRVMFFSFFCLKLVETVHSDINIIHVTYMY